MLQIIARRQKLKIQISWNDNQSGTKEERRKERKVRGKGIIRYIADTRVNYANKIDSSRDTIAMTIPGYLPPIIPFHREYKIRPIRLKLRRPLKMHTVTRNALYVIHSPVATTVRKYIYKAIDRLASMSRSPPKINAESNISTVLTLNANLSLMILPSSFTF